MNGFVLKLLSISLSGAMIALTIFLLRPVLKKRVSKAFMYYIWAIVLLRLIVPFGVGFELPKIIEQMSNTNEYSSISSSVEISIESGEESIELDIDEPLENSVEDDPEISFEIPEESITEISKPEYIQNEENKDNMLPVVGIESQAPHSDVDSDFEQPTIEQNESVLQSGNVEEPKNNRFFELLKSNLFFIWAFGCGAVLLWYSISYISFQRSIKKSFSAPNPDDWRIFNEVCLQHKVLLVMSDKVKIPMLMGVIKPKIVLPKAEFAKNGRTEQLRCILMHELVHYKRRDIVFKWIAIFATSLHWFNPVVYFVKKALDENCELSCDEAVIKNMNDSERNIYGNTLIALSSKEERKRFGMAATLCEDKQQLKERLVSIMKYKKLSRSAICVMIAISLLLVGCATVVPNLGDNSEITESSAESEYNDISSPDENENSDIENPLTEEEILEIKQNYNALREVLHGKKEFYPLGGDFNGEVSLSIENMSTVLGYINTSYPIMFTAVDLDQDGKDEVVLKYSRNHQNDMTYVLHNDDKVYGYYFEEDEMRQLKDDGTFAWNSKNESGYAYIESFEHQTGEENPKAYTKKSFLKTWMEEFENESERVIYHEVEGKLSDAKEFSAQRVVFDKKADAVWCELDEANINNVVAITSKPKALKPFWKTDEAVRAMRAYNRVMNGEVSFFCPKISADAIENEFKIDKLSHYILDGKDDIEIIRFAVIDLDGDNIPEIVNWLSAGADRAHPYFGFQILHYQNARVYSYELVYRAFIDVKYDGTFTGSSGAAYSVISKIEEFLTERNSAGEDCISLLLAQSDMDEENNPIYYIDGKEVSYNEFDQICRAQSEKPSPIWYTFNSTNIEKMISVDILVEQEIPDEKPPVADETIETIELPDGTIKKIERSYFVDSDILRRETITLEKNGVALSREISNYNNDGSLYTHTKETYEGENIYAETVWYYKDGFNAGAIEYISLVNGNQIKAKTYFDGELIEEMFYEDDVRVTNYYLNGEIYYYERTFKTVEFITDKGDRPGNFWDEYTTEQYNPDGTLHFRKVGLVSEYPIDDERFVQIRVAEPGEDWMDLWISLGSGDDSEFVAHILTDLTGKAVLRFQQIADGWTMEEVWALWEDYNTYIDEIEESRMHRLKEIFGDQIYQ